MARDEVAGEGVAGGPEGVHLSDSNQDAVTLAPIPRKPEGQHLVQELLCWEPLGPVLILQPSTWHSLHQQDQ